MPHNQNIAPAPAHNPIEEVPTGASMLAAFDIDGIAGANDLAYPKLQKTALEAKQKEIPLQHHFYESPEGSIEEEKSARSLAIGYLILTADRLQESKAEHKQLLTNRFTESSTELYGTPDASVAHKLIADQRKEFAGLIDNPNVDQTMLTLFLEKLGGEDFEPSAESDNYYETASVVKNLIEQRYGNALSVFDGIETSDTPLSHEQIAELFNDGLSKLAEDDNDWAAWRAEVRRGPGMSTLSKSQIIKIGNRANYEPARLLPLFGHEVLVHAQRSLNGAKTGDKLLRFGLPGNLDTEEGLGGFVEYALTGQLPDKIYDRYIDVSLALGQNDRPALSRKELHSLHAQRQILRKQAAGKEHHPDKVSGGAWNHVDRIYRGSLGNEMIGVNTKDISYYDGFVKMANYLQAAFKRDNPARVFDFVMSGCFDPTDARHLNYKAELQHQ